MFGPSSRMCNTHMTDLDFANPCSPANVPPDCLNLGQGFMNWSPPDWILEESHTSMDTDIMSNHYAHPRGRPRLLKAISKHYSTQFENLVKEHRDLAMDEIVVTAGANCGMLVS